MKNLYFYTLRSNDNELVVKSMYHSSIKEAVYAITQIYMDTPWRDGSTCYVINLTTIDEVAKVSRKGQAKFVYGDRSVRAMATTKQIQAWRMIADKVLVTLPSTQTTTLN